MEYTLQEKYALIRQEVVKYKSKNPIEIIRNLMKEDFIDIHGPEHHFLDGAAFMTAYKNAGGDFDLNERLAEFEKRAAKMPGGMCAYWGVCASVASVGAALSVIHKTGVLSDDEFYKDNMDFTSSVLKKMSEIGGPRCCKRNAFLSLSYGVKFVKEKYGIEMELGDINCEFSSQNKQCIGDKCPFHKKNNK